MRLSQLVGESLKIDPEITGLTADSREVSPGFLFAALSGSAHDGAEYIPMAEKAGAVAVLARPGASTQVSLISDPEPRRRLAQMAARFYPRQPDIVVGITGTNGKTSTARFCEQIWKHLGFKSGSLGTLGASATNFKRELGHTTPHAVMLHETLDEMTQAGVTHLAMEVSSHGLAQYRADGVRLSAAAFTNITQDHLDFHTDFESYRQAKLRLFTELLPRDGVAVINADGQGANRAMNEVMARDLKMLTVGAAGKDLRLLGTIAHSDGIEIKVEAGAREYLLNLPLIGAFQVENALVAAGLVNASGVSFADVLPKLEMLQGVPGRMEHVTDVNGGAIYVDYAHTPDAVAIALKAMRPHLTGKLIVIIGAGGDRDQSKRPLMGGAASANADMVIVSDDNPRTEDPALIRQQVLEGCPGAKEIGDRAQAIAMGIAMIEPGDVLFIAGKGHEQGQIVGGVTLPFDDVQVARAQAAQWGKEIGR